MSDDQPIDNIPSARLVLGFLLMMDPELLRFVGPAGVADGIGKSAKQAARVIADLEDLGIVRGLYHHRHGIHGLELVDREAAEALYEELAGEPFPERRRPPAA